MPGQALRDTACMFSCQPFWNRSLVEAEKYLPLFDTSPPVHLVRFQPEYVSMETIPGVGQMTIIFSCDADRPNAWCYGVQETRAISDMKQLRHILMCRFQPGEFSRLFHVEAHLLANQALPWQDICPGSSLPEQVAAAPDFYEQCARIRRFLQGLENESNSAQRLCHEIMCRVQVSHGNLKMDDLQRDTTYSKRWIQRVIAEQVGTAPKKLFSHTRIQYALKKMGEANVSFAQLAQELGYCDQSHFSRHFKEILGISPGEFIKMRKI